MRNLLVICLAVAIGFSVPGSAPGHIALPTVVTWDGASCQPGVYTITATATSPEDPQSYVSTLVGVTLPSASVSLNFANLPQRAYHITVKAVRQSDGYEVIGTAQDVLGLGDPIVIPPPPPPQVSADCTKGSTVTTATLAVYSLDAVGHLKINGLQVGDALGFTTLWYVGGAVYVSQTGLSGSWKRAELGFASVADPVCAVPTPTPTPPPNPDPILAAIQQSTAELTKQIDSVKHLLTPPSSVTCTITATSTYTNGDQRLTVRCAPSGFTTNQIIEILK